MKKTSNKTRKHVKSLDYDQSVDNKFRAHIDLGSNIIMIEEAEVNVNEKNTSGILTYDEVEETFYKIMENKYPMKSFPEAKIDKIEILPKEEKAWVPVFSESMKDEISKCEKSKSYNRFLVLPEAVYSLTPECKLWLSLIDNGILPEGSEFDQQKMHSILENLNGKSND